MLNFYLCRNRQFLYLYTRVLNIQSCLLFVHIPKWANITKAFRKSGTQRFSTGQDEKWTCCKSECYVLCKKAHIYQYKEQNSSNWQLVITQNGRKVYFKLVEPSKRGKKRGTWTTTITTTLFCPIICLHFCWNSDIRLRYVWGRLFLFVCFNNYLSSCHEDLLSTNSAWMVSIYAVLKVL